MILAVSRFRVANGTDDAVAKAFLDRPRLVDEWPGFLGLETFRDVEDASLFYLVTRWTDVAAFQTWHQSPAHRASHAWMPRGLKLDPAYTKLVEIERLARPQPTDVFELTLDGAMAIARYLEGTQVVHVLKLTLDGTVQFANDAVGDLLGTSPAELVGTAIFPRLTETDAARLRRALSGHDVPEAVATVLLNFCPRADGDPVTLACRIHTTPQDCLVLGERRYESDRQLQQQLVELNQDLAILARQRHRAVAAENAARRAAESADRIKDEALAVIAHELRQPLNAATMALAVLDHRPEALDRVRATLGRQLSHMTKLVEDLLDASRVMRGTIELRRQRLDLGTLTREGVELLEPVMNERQQQLSLSIPSEPVEIDGDPTRVRQVLSNLLTNAAQYTPRGGSIAVSVEPGPAFATVRVRDTGRGIAPAAMAQLFDLFVRGATDTGGLGIGLAVSKRLVQLHGGTIEARSEGLGLGSEFVTRWPQATQSAAVPLQEP